jgi:hypothetical protein
MLARDQKQIYFFLTKVNSSAVPIIVLLTFFANLSVLKDSLANWVPRLQVHDHQRLRIAAQRVLVTVLQLKIAVRFYSGN